MVKMAIIGGTGVYDPQILEGVKEQVVENRYGKVKLLTGFYEDEEIAFIARHGSDHSVPPHLINYRANIMALKQIGVKHIIGTAAVGSLHFEYKPGDIVLADQFLDFTRSRITTFYEGGEEGVIHCDMTVAYCPLTRAAIMEAGQQADINVANGGVYVCTDGPRFETGAEIAMFKQLGGHVIGMTSVPEVTLARELGICYANISIVTNYAAGISAGILTHAEVVEMMKSRIQQVREIMMKSAALLPETRECDCVKILDEIGVGKHA
ncbi:MAG: S-methyl-5'-thioadenosine phosphorylase [Syntrophomonadaceae bacterium]|nr:S-methyl-5'-thioadenosine phosphorylase [Syntrophomonadaceae bacterium]